MQGCAGTDLYTASDEYVPASVWLRPKILLRCLLATACALACVFASPASAVYGVAGDLAPIGNPDSVLNVADVLILQRMVLGGLAPSPEQILVGDVAPIGNPDGELNAADVVVLMRAVHGMVSLPPVFIRPDAPVMNELPSATTTNPLSAGGNAVPGATVRIYVNGDIQTEVVADGNGQFTGDLNLFDGANSVSITVWDGIAESAHSAVMDVEYTNVLPRSLTNITITEDAVWTPGSPTQPYAITGSLVVSEGITLTLMPGTELVFADGAGLQVLGALEIDGTTGDPVQLTAQTQMPGRWQGLSADSLAAQLHIANANIEWASTGVRVENGATLDLQDTHVYGSQEYGVFVGSGATATLLGNTIEYTGSFYGGPNGVFVNPGTGLRIEGASPLLQGNIIRHHYYGIEIFRSSSPRIENNNTITLNAIGIGAFGDYVDELNNPAPFIQGNTIADNTSFNYQAGGYVANGNGNPEMVEVEQDLSGNWWGSTDPNLISTRLDGFSRNWYNTPALKVTPFLDGPGGNVVPGNYLGGLVRQVLTIANDQSPIVVGDLVIAGNGVLDVQPGVQLEVALQGGVSSLGGLHLAGTENTPIVIRSHSAQPAAGDWRGVIVAGANANLQYVTIEHATTAVAALSDQAIISNCNLRNFSNSGVDVHGALVVIEDSHIQGVNKTGVGVYLRANTDTVSQRNQFDGLARAIDINPGSTPRIEANLISGNAYGIYIGRTNYADPPARPDILNGNQIVDNDYGVYVKSYGNNSWYTDHQPRVNNNQIHGNAIYNYHADGFPVTTVLDATQNYWGSDDPAVIRVGISSDQVQYSPYTNSAGVITYAGTIGPILDEDIRIQPGPTLSLPNGLIVPVGRTLTLAPGARIEVSPGKAIVINGNIVVETGGTAPVFTVTGGVQNQYWKGFVINSPNQVIHDVTIEQATYGVEVVETSATVRDSTFRRCATACVYAHGSYRAGALYKANVFVERIDVALAGSGKGLYYFYANGSVYGSSITGALYGMEVAGSSSVVVKYNTIASNGRGVYVRSGTSGGIIYDPSVTLNWNNVGQNTNYAFYSEILQINPGRQMDGRSNWWNTTIASQIPPKIYDANDGDSRRARLVYDPFSASAIPLPPSRFVGAAPIATGQAYPVSGEGIPNGLARIYADGAAVANLSIDSQGQFSGAVSIAEGVHTLYAVNVANNFESYKSRELQVTVDSSAPTITLVEPVGGIRTNRSVWTMRGHVSESATLTINGQPVTLSPTLDFAYGPIALNEGPNTIDIMAVDVAGNEAVENVEVTVDSQPPPAIASDRVSLGPLANGQLTVTGAPAAADSGSQITIVNARTGQVYIGVAGGNGGFALTVGAQPGDPLFMYTTDDLGNQSGWYNVNVSGSAPVLALNIEQPQQGASINDSVINVEGTYAGPANTSIVVNGVTAILEGGRFYADAVPLEAGSQTITATASTLAGGIATDTVGVTGTGQALPAVIVNEVWGVGDHEVTLDVQVPPALVVAAVEYDFDGNGLSDQSATPDESVTYTYNTPGLHVLAGTIRLQSGQSYPFQRHIVVADVQGLHGHLRANWQDFAGQLGSGEVATSMPFITEEARAKFESILTANAANLPAMVASLGDIAGFSVLGDVATLTILRTESGRSVAFKVYFLRDDDGLWRISAM